jgi:hypothetical protein
MHMKTPAALSAALTLAAAPAAGAAVKRTTSARSVARAIVERPAQLRGARWLKRPPRGDFAGVSSTHFVGFPRSGKTFGLLSSGNAGKIGAANGSGSLSTNNRGAKWRGTRDTVVLRVDLNVPASARCLSVRFRFLSDEFPEFAHSAYNDAFLAELDHSNWTAATGGSKIRAPRNFAFVRHHRLVSVNGAGDFAVTRDRARGTTYDAGTRRLRASIPVTPGHHSVYLTIFDQGDRQYDSTVVLDQLVANGRTPCVAGAALA